MRIERWRYRIPLRLRSLFRRDEVETELHAALRQHIEEKERYLMERGMSPEEARDAALHEFGGIEPSKENSRDRRKVSWLEDLAQDIRYGQRTLRKSPGFTAIAVVTLALGIGANTAIFSLVNGILLAPLPFAEPKQLVSVKGTYPKGAFVAMREQIQSMDVATYAEGHEINLTGAGDPVRLEATLVSAELFSVLGVRPEAGRPFYPGEDKVGQDNVVILSHSLWQQRFAGDPRILGRSILLEGVSREVVGVMAADFRFPSAKTQVWIPLHNDPRNAVSYWAGDFMPVIARLHRNTNLEQARTEIRSFQSQVFAKFPWPMPASWNADVSLVPLQSGMVADVRTRLLVLLGAVGMVLLIACANVANLTLSRAATREKEIAVRLALGAARQRIARQLLAESVLLACLGAVVGLFIASRGLVLLKSTLPADTPRLLEAEIDWRVLAFTGMLAIFTGIVFGMAPALQSSRGTIVDALKSGGRGAAASVSHRLRSALVVAEVALSVLLVISAGLLIRSFWALSHVDPGFHTDHVITARITPDETFCSDTQRCLTFYRGVIEQVGAAPGVSNVALVNTLPLNGRVAKRSLDLEGYTPPAGEDSPVFWLHAISPDYFRVMGIPLAAGREFTNADASSEASPAIVTAATARRYWPTGSAVGKHVRFVGDKNWRTVVGVIPDLKEYNLQRDVPEWIAGSVYVPIGPSATEEDGKVPTEMTIAVRTRLDEGRAGATLRSIVFALNAEAPVSEIRTMRSIASEAVSTPASTTYLFVAFAALALALGVIGIYGVLSFLVSKRTREIGIRIALGAQRRDVLWLIMQEGARFSFAGIAVGLAGAVAVTRVLSSELYGVDAMDPLTFFAVAVGTAIVTLAATYIPTRRAMRTDPLIALRSE